MSTSLGLLGAALLAVGLWLIVSHMLPLRRMSIERRANLIGPGFGLSSLGFFWLFLWLAPGVSNAESRAICPPVMALLVAVIARWRFARLLVEAPALRRHAGASGGAR